MSDQEAKFNAKVREWFSWEKTRKAAHRLTDRAFDNPGERPRFSIPTQPDDDDVLIEEALRRGEAAEARVAALIAAGEGLWQYTDHMPSCALNHRYDDPEVDPDAVTCDCGYRESNRTWKRAKEGRDG